MKRVLALVLLSLLLAACASPPAVELRGSRFVVEIADDDRERERGLMFRESLAPDAGMLFVFPDQDYRAFWMKNCRIGLDILYFDADLKLVGQALDVPPCSMGDRCPSYPSGAPARFVLEVNPGTARRLGVSLGDRLTLSNIRVD